MQGVRSTLKLCCKLNLRVFPSRRICLAKTNMASFRIYYAPFNLPDKVKGTCNVNKLSCNGCHCWHTYKCVIIGIYFFAMFKGASCTCLQSHKDELNQILSASPFFKVLAYFTSIIGKKQSYSLLPPSLPRVVYGKI